MSIQNELRHGVRMLRRKPAYSVAALISITLGIVACTTVFSIVDTIMFRSVPFPDGEKIVRLHEASEKGNLLKLSPTVINAIKNRSDSFGTIEDILDNKKIQSSIFESVAKYKHGEADITYKNKTTRVKVAWATPQFLDVLGVDAVEGIAFNAKNKERHPLVLVSHKFRHSVIGKNEDMKKVTLNISRDIYHVGVLPEHISYPENVDAWFIYLGIGNSQLYKHDWDVVARLKPGISEQTARLELDRIHKDIRKKHGMNIDSSGLRIVSLKEQYIAPVRPGLLLLSIASVLLLVVACSNITNILLAQINIRTVEFATRSAMGAGVIQSIRQLLIENLVLNASGGVLAIILSKFTLGLVLKFNPGIIPRTTEISINFRAMIFALGLSLMISVTTGIIAALRIDRKNLSKSLIEGRHSASIRGRLAPAIITGQTAVTVVLLVGAGLLMRNFLNLLYTDPGFNGENVVAMSVAFKPALPSKNTTDDLDAVENLKRKRIVDAIAQIPGVKTVGEIDQLPMTYTHIREFKVNEDSQHKGEAEVRSINGNYFDAMKIPLLRGRTFNASDNIDTNLTSVISKSFVEKYFHGQEPLGQSLQIAELDGSFTPYVIIGIVGDVLEYGLDKQPSASVYTSYTQSLETTPFSVVVKSKLDMNDLTGKLHKVVLSTDENASCDFTTLDLIVSNTLKSRRFLLGFFGFFAVFGLLLAIAGIYGVISYIVSQREKEIGIRISLGASTLSISSLIAKLSYDPVFIGIIIGLLGSVALSRFIMAHIEKISATDTVTYVSVVILIAISAAIASIIPTRRALKVDPLIALKSE